MNPATNRRAILGAVLAAGAAMGTVHVAAATAATNELTESDRQAIEQWVRYRAMSARLWDLALQIEAAEERLPDWAQVGPKWLCGPGVDKEGGYSELPAIIVTTPVAPGTKINVRPSAKDIRAAHNARYEQIRNGPGGDEASCRFIVADVARLEREGHPVESALKRGAEFYQKKFAGRSADPSVSTAFAALQESYRIRVMELAALERRKEAQAAERRRVGLVELQAEHDRVADEISAIMDEISGAELRGPHALAAALMIRMDELHGSDDAIERAPLSALRPQLVGAIAEDADRVLAQDGELRS